MHTIRMVAVTKDAQMREWLADLPPAGGTRVEVLSTASAQQAATLARDEDTRLVLLDDTVTENGGLQRLAQRVRRAQRDLSVVCVISRPAPKVEVELRRIGVLYIVVRPVDLSLLERVLHQALRTDTRKHYKPGTPPVGVPALTGEMEA